MATKRTLRSWWDYLDDPKREYTLDEFVAVMTKDAREYARMTAEHTLALRSAIEHVEGMLDTLDRVMSVRDPIHAELGAKRGEMVPALDAARRNGSGRA